MIITAVDSMLRLPQYLEPNADNYTMGNTSTVNKAWFREQLSRIGMSQRQLAKRINVDPAAISYMLAGKRGMSMDEARAIAGELLLPVTEVMRQAGIEVLDDVRKVPVAGYIGPGSTVTLLPKGTQDSAMAPPDVPSGSFAIQVRMVQTTFDGWLYFVSGVQEAPETTMDCLCLVALDDGRLLQGIVRRGYKRELFNLVLSPDGGTVLENQKIAWAARVLWIQPL
ncbi:HTH_XRE domain containing protein [uncultured Caudovirales phage]|uniref:HTH_XRE domain containing protein n=1 Tax=uncultured Caudovirales phage TaxID=2100421 RepID=A0A6J5LFH8_9CAUD|nr:HTH_XRE domain containing protein [uncultured Caudovirales phage]